MRLSPSNPLRRPGYRYLVSFTALAAMGGGFHFVASFWIVYAQSSSATDVAWLIIAFWLPSLLILPVGGVLIDRHNRRHIMAMLYGYLALLNVGLVCLMLADVFETWHLYVYGCLAAMAHALTWTTITAYLQQVLTNEELLHANSLNVGLFQGGYLLGAGTAGFVYDQIGAVSCFSIDASCQLVAVVGWLSLGRWFADRTPSPESQDRTSMWAEFVTGLRYIITEKRLFLFALFMLVPRLAAQSINALHIGLSKDVLKVGATGFGLMDTAYGLGAMACGFAFPIMVRRSGVRPLLPVAALVAATASLVAISGADSLLSAMAGLCVLGATVHIVGVIARTTLQQRASNDVMGRVTSVVQIFQYLLIPPLVWLLGNYADQTSGRMLHSSAIRDAFVAAAVLFALLTVASALVMRPYLRTRLERLQLSAETNS